MPSKRVKEAEVGERLDVECNADDSGSGDVVQAAPASQVRLRD